ncbi:uncharacterized protein Z520_00681 [Fonsecaea multimorphosa CBS 102226]|uniref:Uncharacterized protein n=1 Tax=Fonsecaea multimorphosa CBS 102226 TaxID=1442371 RepID=A0A0D2L4L2_9EURO|nr:uncharacterized protein Z520_00681 [Fonsecaea multimorphosa CBS 102226]KIY03989.1 hypothetical protein Z520_00681 [Fonsecaea multimorphosa CBS 102226]OAL31828.1 hypothetical protein AYO22_00698 [Fonsecaea multimorphosa]
METSALASVIHLHEWVDRLCATEPEEYLNSWGQYCKRMGNESPLCDMLLSKGVLPVRNARPWSDAFESEITPQSQSCSRRRLHAAVNILDQPLTDTGEGLGISCATIDQQPDAILDSNDQNRKPPRPAIFEPLLRKKRSFALKTRHGQAPNVTPERHTSGDFPAAITCQYVSTLEYFRGVLLSCSTKLATFSSEILNNTKPTAG